jgi:hypothetical protein
LDSRSSLDNRFAYYAKFNHCLYRQSVERKRRTQKAGRGEREEKVGRTQKNRQAVATLTVRAKEQAGRFNRRSVCHS